MYRTTQCMIPAYIGVFFDSSMICCRPSVCLAARHYEFSYGCHVLIQLGVGLLRLYGEVWTSWT